MMESKDRASAPLERLGADSPWKFDQEVTTPTEWVAAHIAEARARVRPGGRNAFRRDREHEYVGFRHVREPFDGLYEDHRRHKEGVSSESFSFQMALHA